MLREREIEREIWGIFGNKKNLEIKKNLQFVVKNLTKLSQKNYLRWEKKIEKLEMERNYDIYLFVGFWIVDVDGDVGRINKMKKYIYKSWKWQRGVTPLIIFPLKT